VAGFCEHSNEHSSSIKCVEFIAYLQLCGSDWDSELSLRMELKETVVAYLEGLSQLLWIRYEPRGLLKGFSVCWIAELLLAFQERICLVESVRCPEVSYFNSVVVWRISYVFCFPSFVGENVYEPIEIGVLTLSYAFDCLSVLSLYIYLMTWIAQTKWRLMTWLCIRKYVLKEAVMTNFEVTFQLLPGGTKKNHGKVSGYLVNKLYMFIYLSDFSGEQKNKESLVKFYCYIIQRLSHKS
jgi:hypothetical protein